MENTLSIDVTADQIVDMVNGHGGGIIRDWVLGQIMLKAEHIVLYGNKAATPEGRVEIC